MTEIEYILQQTKALLAIDSPSGYTKHAANYLKQEYERLGYHPVITTKGGILADLGGEDSTGAIMLEAHMDTLGAMVAEIKENGRLRLSPIGGLNPNNVETENCRVITRKHGIFEGTYQPVNASIHVNGDYDTQERCFEKMEVVLDEKVTTRKDTSALGIMSGDFVCFDPRFALTKKGFIKSRFLDDKLSVGILLGYARYLTEQKQTPKRRIYQHITAFEEVGHGGSSSIPKDVTEVLSVDMGCIGEGLSCSEHQVSICAKDSRGPYHYEVVSSLIEAAQDKKLDFAVDVYPHYGSDADAALTAGYDIRHGLIGAGVYASHGYERSHTDGVKNTLELLKAYLG